VSESLLRLLRRQVLLLLLLLLREGLPWQHTLTTLHLVGGVVDSPIGAAHLQRRRLHLPRLHPRLLLLLMMMLLLLMLLHHHRHRMGHVRHVRGQHRDCHLRMVWVHDLLGKGLHLQRLWLLLLLRLRELQLQICWL